MATAARRQWDSVRIVVGRGMRVPLRGTVGAGASSQTGRNEQVFPNAAGLWNGRRVFGLRVRGASLLDEGLRDGDHLLVEPRETAESGQTVLVQLDGRVTVKRLVGDRGGSVHLQPASPEMLPLDLRPERARIVGVVIGILRRQGPCPPARSRLRSRRPERADPQTFDLRLGAIEQSVSRAESLAAARTGRSAERLRALTRSLRGLRDWYLHTRVPRLREALLREAAALRRQLGRFGAERS